MADNNKKQFIKYENTTYLLEDHRLPDPTAEDNGKVLGVVNGAYALKQEQGGGSGAVTSVNGKTGAVVLDAEDVGALPDDTPIPSAVTEQDVAGWGFTKNTGTYSKPSGGIPASDLASDVQTSLGKADSAYQKPSGGIPASDLAVGVIPDISGKVDKVTGYGLVSSRDVTNGYELAINENGTVTNLPVVAISSYNTAMQQASQALAAKANAADVYTKTEIDSKGYQTAAQVQTAIAPLQPKAITDTGGYFTTDTVEGALQEIGAELSGINTLIGSGVIS